MNLNETTLISVLKKSAIKDKAKKCIKYANKLRSHGIDFLAVHHGAQFVINSNGSRIDFWPQTEAYITSSGITGKGFDTVLNLCTSGD